MQIATRVELPSQVMIGTAELGVRPKMRFQAPRSSGFGTRVSGCAVASASVLNDVTSWIRNGPMKISAKMPSSR